jgi:hypothetical protein
MSLERFLNQMPPEQTEKQLIRAIATQVDVLTTTGWITSLLSKHEHQTWLNAKNAYQALLLMWKSFAWLAGTSRFIAQKSLEERQTTLRNQMIELRCQLCNALSKLDVNKENAQDADFLIILFEALMIRCLQHDRKKNPPDFLQQCTQATRTENLRPVLDILREDVQERVNAIILNTPLTDEKKTEDKMPETPREEKSAAFLESDQKKEKVAQGPEKIKQRLERLKKDITALTDSIKRAPNEKYAIQACEKLLFHIKTTIEAIDKENNKIIANIPHELIPEIQNNFMKYDPVIARLCGLTENETSDWKHNSNWHFPILSLSTTMSLCVVSKDRTVNSSKNLLNYACSFFASTPVFETSNTCPGMEKAKRFVRNFNDANEKLLKAHKQVRYLSATVKELLKKGEITALKYQLDAYIRAESGFLKALQRVFSCHKRRIYSWAETSSATLSKAEVSDESIKTARNLLPFFTPNRPQIEQEHAATQTHRLIEQKH